MSRTVERAEQNRKRLTEALNCLLRETAFDNRYALHPRRLSAIGTEQATSFLEFLASPDEGRASANGALLAQEGLGEKVVLKLASSIRDYCRPALAADAGAAERYTTLLLEGYLAAWKAQMLTDQEQLRKALSTALASQSQDLLIKNHAVNTSINGIMLADLDGKVTWVNASYLRMWGFDSPEQVIGLPFEGFWVPEDRDHILEGLPRTGGWHGQLQARRKDEGVFNVELSVSLIRNEEQTPVGIMSSVIDITEHLKAEEMEKNLLLAKEIHHRIKNNLQVISSLLFLQSGYVEDSKTREMFKESQNRVRSMALLHEKLYQSKDLAGVDSAEYLKDLTRNLFSSYGGTSTSVELGVEAAGITLGMDTAVPCGLIINELVSNSLKHAFPTGAPGQIRVELRPAEAPADAEPDQKSGRWFRLVVSDNGAGFPAHVDFRNTESLGLRIVCALTEQLRGRIDLDRQGGSRFTILFREA
jgi:PAS domain S-box-containing protein